MLLAVALLPLAAGAQAAASGSAPRSAKQLQEKTSRAYGKLPLSLIPNAGQANRAIRYYARGPGYSFTFARRSAMFAFSKGRRGVALQLRFVGGRPDVRPEGNHLLPGKVNYLIGNDPADWRTGLPTFAQVAYRDLWPGIDLVFHGTGDKLEYEFLVAPGARVSDIQLAYRGASRVVVDGAGNLVMETALGPVKDARPVSYQVIDRKRVPVESRFALGPHAAYGFALRHYDSNRPLVIDPGLVYSTYLGGSGTDTGTGITVDAAGDAYVTGLTSSTNFPTSPGAYDSSYNGGPNDVFVTKLNPAGTSLLYSTYIGGSGDDQGKAIAIDSLGNAYVTGLTTSTNFPTAAALPPPSEASDTSANGGEDAFVAKLNSTGTNLVYSTYLGGSGRDNGTGIAVNSDGEAYVTGLTGSDHFPFTPAALDNSLNGNLDAFMTVVDRFGTGFAYSSYLGGNGDDQGRGIGIDPTGDAFITGQTTGSFPTTAGAADTSFNGLEDAFVTRLNFTDSGLSGDVFVMTYSTYVGGGGTDRGLAIALDTAGDAYINGLTNSGNFPTTLGAYDRTFNGNIDAYATKLNPLGTSLVYSTYLGGSGDDRGGGIAVDPSGAAYLTGRTPSANFPTTAGAQDTTANGGDDVFVTKFDPTGATLVYSTYLGGSSTDQGQAIALDPTGVTYVTGVTSSPNFPTTLGAYDTSLGDGSDAFVTKLLTVGAPTRLVLTPPTATNQVGTPHTVTATVTDVANQPVSGVTVRFTVTVSNPTSGSSATDASGQATFTYTGTHAGPDTITAYADTNNNGTQDAGEPSGVATKLWTPGPPATLTLEPATGVNVVDSRHCVTATVTDAFGNPVPNVTVRFSVPTAVATHASPASGSAVTDSNGQAQFCYTAALPGEDVIHAFADTNGNGTQDPGEPFDDATKTWTVPPRSAFCEAKITDGGWIIAANGDRANFGGNADISSDGSEVQGQQEYQDHGPADTRNVHSIELTATTCSDDLRSATIFGTATIDGSGEYVFRIDLTDHGKDDTYGIILSDGYESGQQPLEGGNVTIHKT